MNEMLDRLLVLKGYLEPDVFKLVTELVVTTFQTGINVGMDAGKGRK